MNNQTSVDEYSGSLWSRDFTLLFLSNFFMFFGADILMPVLPVYMSQNNGSNFQIGIVMGCFTLSAIFVRLFAVKLTWHLGKSLFLMAGLFVCALAACGYYFTTVISLIFFIRVLHGFGFGAATTLYGAIASDIIPKSRIGEGMSYFGLGVVVAAAIGPFLGAMIVLSPDYHWIFFLSSALILVSILLTKAGKVGRGREDDRNGAGAKFSLADFFEIKVIFPSILALIVAVSFSGIFTFIVLFGKEVGIKSIGTFFLVTSIAELLVRSVSGRLYDKRGHFVVLVPGALACLAGTILLSLSAGLPMLIAASAFYGLGVGMIFPALQAWALKSVDPGRRVAATATFYNLVDTGIALGSVILGLVAQKTTFAHMYMYSSLTFVLFLLIYLSYYFKTASRHCGPIGLK